MASYSWGDARLYSRRSSFSVWYAYCAVAASYIASVAFSLMLILLFTCAPFRLVAGLC